MEFDAVFTVKKEFEQEDFLRQVLIALGTDANTPVDMCDAKFGEVKESVKEVILCSDVVSGRCTASIGYDRKEPYTDYETYKEKVGDTYVTRQRAVTKYRTVTDWSPFSTDFSGKASYVTANEDEEDPYREYASRALRTVADDSIIPDGEAYVNRSAMNRAVMHCEAHVEVHNVDLPGDKKKDVRYQCSSEIDWLACYKLPYYQVTYTYEGQQYAAAAFACGDISVHYTAPKQKVETASNPAAEIEENAHRKTAVLAASKKMAWWIFWGTVGVSITACYLLKFCWVWPAAVAALFYACSTNKKYNKKYLNCAEELAWDYARKKAYGQAIHMTAKVDALNRSLSDRGYETLSEEETPVIDGESDAVIAKNKPKVEPAKSYKGKAVFCTLVAIALIIFSLVMNSKVLHSPDQMNIGIVNKTVAYDPDAKPYINGCYYVYFDFEVEAKKTGIDYVEMKVYVSDNSGNDLGFLRVSLSDLSIEPGEKKTVTVTFDENQPEKNEFFVKMYNYDLSELNFVYEIGSIAFEDGVYYHNEDYNQFA